MGRTSTSRTKIDGVQAAFLNAVRAAGCFHPGDPVVLGVSGGADSLAMLRLFTQARSTLGVQPHVFHLNHHIRGAAAEADAVFVAETCRAWGVPCRVAEADVPALARENRHSVEDAARQARYRALVEEAKRVGARVIAVAHNADDQAETVLMHFLRGSGLAGLRGMRPVTPLAEFAFLDSPGDLLLLRPLLDIPRAEIDAYCAANGLTPRLDQTNLDTMYTRNKLRREIIPLLETINPAFKQTMSRTASVIQGDFELLSREAEAAWKLTFLRHIEHKISPHAQDSERSTEGEAVQEVQFDRDTWRSLPVALQRAMMLRAVKMIAPRAEIGFSDIEQAIDTAAHGETASRRAIRSDLFVHLSYHTITVSNNWQLHNLPPPDRPLFSHLGPLEIIIPAMGGYALPGTQWRFVIEPYAGPRSGPEWDALLRRKWVQPFSADRLTFPLQLRVRHPLSARHFQPYGMGGTQVSIKEFMQRAKIPQEWRNEVPILVYGEKLPFTVIWLCGWRLDERFAVTPETKDVWLARFEKSSEE